MDSAILHFLIKQSKILKKARFSIGYRVEEAIEKFQAIESPDPADVNDIVSEIMQTNLRFSQSLAKIHTAIEDELSERWDMDLSGKCFLGGFLEIQKAHSIWVTAMCK